MKVLVTGADGFTGRYVVETLAHRGHRAHSFRGDLTDPGSTMNAVSAQPFDAVLHLGGVAFVHATNWSPFYSVNQLGTFNLLEAVSLHRPGAHVVLASSANIYGNSESEWLDETIVPQPTNHYANSKLAMEQGARLWSDRLKITIARPFNYTGVGQQTRYLVPKIVDHFRRRAPCIELGNIDVIRDIGDVRSVADAYVSILETELTGTFNIATGTPHSIRDIIDLCSLITAHNLTIESNPDYVRSGEIRFLAGDPSRLKAALPQWAPRSLGETLQWMLDDPTH